MREGQKMRTARRLRQAANTPEQKAWTTLRKLRAEGFPVRRQHPVGPYVADFAVVKEGLVIEIDGGIHRLPDVAARDAERQSVIEALGWRVLRITPEIAASPDHLLEAVRAILVSLPASTAPSPPAPLPLAGEGGGAS